ncbi:hypothetical protein EROM_041340 [Encephalitozoon romaleae SJ-2008]|uniref:Uncharacterized protein n=1 Tax=Encephalitozoon romaleae (strain SJ-2008) TaxID=1178016 RepID=I7AE46_ENCRO|nr:hypothetical protein EROM_041340 [Encephalitozoon romaleae SJ-2008]AFN82900.1 hypothetical protein EROM_041340 [Encephalitozoon romaleae SJ-2008]
MEGCSHLSISRGVCTSCGLCLESEYGYMASYALYSFVAPKKMKYLASDKSGRYSKNVKSLVNILNVPGYYDEVKQLLETKRFRDRIGANDKILAIIYNVLRRHQYPISYSDLEPFTEKTSSRFKRILLREFEYVETSLEYLSAIFDRVRDFYLTQGFKGNRSLRDFVSISRSNKNINPYYLCLAYFIKDEDLLNTCKKFELDEIVSMSSLKRILKKIQKAEDPTVVPMMKKRLRIKDNARKYLMKRLQDLPYERR